MSSRCKHIVAFLLLLSFVWYIVPKEVLHAFVTHTDTVHHSHVGLYFDSEHHHCELMKIDQEFNADDQISFYNILPHVNLFFSNQQIYHYTSHTLNSNLYDQLLRGPPYNI